MPNSPKAGTVSITMRVTKDLAARAEYLAEQLTKEHPGLEYDRLDAIRLTLGKHLPQLPEGWRSAREEAPAPAPPALPAPKRSGRKR